jgi:hypothetical protein
MVTEDLILTNWHCGGSVGMDDNDYWNSDVCANTVVDLGWAAGRATGQVDLGWAAGRAARQYYCVAVVAQDKSLDYALLRLAPMIGPGGSSGEPVAVRTNTELPVQDGIFLVHHARCKPKLLSAPCRILSREYPVWPDGQDKAGFTHDCDTDPGASGAPIFDLSGRLIGLHHFGFKRDKQCNKLDHENKAVKIKEIIESLRQKTTCIVDRFRTQ